MRSTKLKNRTVSSKNGDSILIRQEKIFDNKKLRVIM